MCAHFKESRLFFQFAVAFHDNTPLSRYRLVTSRLSVSASIIMRSGGTRSVEFGSPEMSEERGGVWELPVDLRTQLGTLFRFGRCL